MTKNQKRNLVLFTDRFPYGVGENFIEVELPYLLSEFENVILVPLANDGKCREISEKIILDTGIISSRKNKLIRGIVLLGRCLLEKEFYKEIFRNIAKVTKLTVINKIVRSMGNAIEIAHATESLMSSRNLNSNNTLFYTYWINSATIALSLLKKRQHYNYVSRVHGGDLYEDRYSDKYLPYRSLIFNSIDKIYPISEHGKNYLVRHHPEVSNKIKVYRLGIANPDGSSFWVKQDDKVIVSCSYLEAVKRVDILIDGLVTLAEMMPNKILYWYHIGDGPLFKKIQDKAEKDLPKNVNAIFMGYKNGEEIRRFYKNTNIDVFINVSSSEGIPVSIMEAQSFGIPVIAPNVGGLPEIVNEKIGLLMESNPSSREVAESLKTILTKTEEETNTIRANTWQNWQSNYSAEINYTKFVKAISKLNEI